MGCGFRNVSRGVACVSLAFFNLLMKTRCFVGCGFRNVSRGVACVSLAFFNLLMKTRCFVGCGFRNVSRGVACVSLAFFNLLMKTRCFVGCGFRNVSLGVACVSLVWQNVFHQYLLRLDMGLPKTHLLYSPFKNFKKYNHENGNSQKVARLCCGNSRMPKFKVRRL